MIYTARESPGVPPMDGQGGSAEAGLTLPRKEERRWRRAMDDARARQTFQSLKNCGKRILNTSVVASPVSAMRQKSRIVCDGGGFWVGTEITDPYFEVSGDLASISGRHYNAIWGEFSNPPA